MILDNDELIRRLEKRPNRKVVDFGRELHRRAILFIHGEGMASYLQLIEGFERPTLKSLRVKYAQTTQDLFARLEKPITKVFTARGGHTYYNLTDANWESAIRLDRNIYQGKSIKKWLDQHWRIHMQDDPMGFIFMEIGRDSKAYPTYKSICDVYEYQLNGPYLDYVIFQVEREQKIELGLEDEAQVYRVVDDLFDRMVILKADKTLVEVPNQTFTNYFHRVPAMLNSYIENPRGQGTVSLFHKIFDLADQYILKASIMITHEFHHGFPKYWEFADDCIECSGTGKLNGVKHTACKGTGKKLMTSVSDIKMLEFPTKDAPASFVPYVGGYIEPSKIFWEIASHSIEALDQKMNQTLWGSKNTTKMKEGVGLSTAPNGTVTATEVMDNRQPEIEVLNAIAQAAEERHKFILDLAIMAEIDAGYVEAGGSSVGYGRRYLIEEPDTLLDRFMKARVEGASATTLFGMYEEYLEAKYQNDPISLGLHKKLLSIEPDFCYTVEQLKMAGATPEQVRAKMQWPNWLAQTDGAMLTIFSAKQLKANFEAYLKTKPLPVEEKPEPSGAPKAKKKPVKAS